MSFLLVLVTGIIVTNSTALRDVRSGEFVVVDVNDDDVVKMAAFATEALSSRRNKTGQLKLDKIVAAKKQTSFESGVKFEITTTYFPDNSKNSWNCDLVITHQPWSKSNNTKLIQSSCTDN